jgi:hypothetical protein
MLVWLQPSYESIVPEQYVQNPIIVNANMSVLLEH